LPAAVESASAIAKRYDNTGRVTYKAGNALEDDLGTDAFDVVMINNVVHHFTAEQNVMLAKKIARALKTGGIYIIGEFVRSHKPGEGGAVGATSGLYFSVISASGNWSENEMQGWQRNAGLSSS
jgi:2-polyprenyl-3-methyl-5-hydroxy-6-metoxy-1,4-benzoquinol methylase